MTTSAPSKRNAVYTIPAGVPFAKALVNGINEVADDPADIARALVLVPSRRAARALRLAFLEVNEKQPMLLPRMLPIGDVDEDDPALFELELGGDGIVDIPPAINKLRRQMMLARLLEGFALGGQRPTFGGAMMLASALGDLLDQVTTVGSDLSQLRDMLPDRFSQHWQDIMVLLNLLVDRWPDILAGEGVIDLAVRRELLARARIAAWQATPPEGLVIVAGSTGTFAATRDLIACVAGLARGHVVLPGLDRGASAHWPQIIDDLGHPQHQLATLLAHLEVAPEEVDLWPYQSEGQSESQSEGQSEGESKTAQRQQSPNQQVMRQEVMREVFAPASLTTKWRQLPGDRPDIKADCLDGLQVISCPDINAEAAVIALALRETLETPGKTAALITPDRGLAEAVIVALRRWNIFVDDSAGTPLSQCAAGGFLQLLANALAAEFAPVPLLALLKHPLAAGGMAPADFRINLSAIERAVLRGHRPASGLEGLIASLSKKQDLQDFVRYHLLAPLHVVIDIWQGGAPALSALAAALALAAEQLAAQCLLPDGSCDAEDGAQRLWSGFDGQAAAEVMRDLSQHTSDIGIDPAQFPQVLGQLFAEKPVRRRWPLHPRLAVLGPVEARMQSADRLIVAGFNEGNWPPRPEPDPWMNAEMRRTVGLPARNWRTGLSAHDVYMAICAPEVIVTRALRHGDTATTPSRWLQRLDAVIDSLGFGTALDKGEQWLGWAAQLNPTPPFNPITRPMPTPPIAARPRQFSATEVDYWISDPYHIYAKKILRLRKLDDLDRPPDAALRGTLMHHALAVFIERYPKGPLPRDALSVLEAIGRETFAPQFHNPGVKYFWWPRFLAVAGWFITNEENRRQHLQQSYAEVEGRITIEGPAGPVVFTARADRLDRDDDGGVRVIDYKTGAAPSASQVAAGRRTQLLIEALIAAEGGFEGLPPAVFGGDSGDVLGNVSGMEYWQLSGRRGQIALPTDVMPPEWLAKDVRDQLTDLVTSFDDPATAYASEPDKKHALPYSNYRHLARLAEWQTEANDE